MQPIGLSTKRLSIKKKKQNFWKQKLIVLPCDSLTIRLMAFRLADSGYQGWVEEVIMASNLNFS